MARARSLADRHDRVGGAIIGRPVSPADEATGDWGRLRYAESIMRELAAVVSYVADAEERDGHAEAAAHYRRLWEQASSAITDLHRLGTGAATLPTSLLDDVRLGVDRLNAALEAVTRIARPADFDAPHYDHDCPSSDAKRPLIRGRSVTHAGSARASGSE